MPIPSGDIRKVESLPAWKSVNEQHITNQLHILFRYMTSSSNLNETILPSNPSDRTTAHFWAAYIDEKWFPSMSGIARAQGEEAKKVVIDQVMEGLSMRRTHSARSARASPSLAGTTSTSSTSLSGLRLKLVKGFLLLLLEVEMVVAKGGGDVAVEYDELIRAQQLGVPSDPIATLAERNDHMCLLSTKATLRPWVIDSGATHHMTSDQHLLASTSSTSSTSVSLADGSQSKVTGSED
ncbi:hypothetical protein NL676_012934 [Syzygium grande]|nr:hypothetical protein NL676_012934 [Syzygium grande]